MIEGSDRDVRDVQVPAGDNPYNPMDGTTLIVTACDLLNAYLHLGQHILDTKFTSPGEGIFPGRNDCSLIKPLVGDKAEYRINFFIWTEQEGSILDGEWEVNGYMAPGLGTWEDEYRAIFDAGSSQHPSTLELGEGLVSVAAYANFYFQLPEEFGGIWMNLHKGGTLAAGYEPDELRHRFESLARFIMVGVRSFHNVEQ